MSAFRPTFVSHAHADNEECDRFVAALRSQGIDIWYDRENMQGGDQLGAEIEAQLEQRMALVVLLTPDSVASYWVNMEVSAFRDLAAHDPKRVMLPVRIADCSIPLLMRGLKWIDALAMPFEEAIDKITSALATRTPTATLAPPETPSQRPETVQPARSLPPRTPDKTLRRPTSTVGIFEMIPLASIQHLYFAYMAWYVDRVTRHLDETMAGLRAELRENDAKEASFRPSPNELYAIERLRRSGVTGLDLLDRMVEQGEDWLMVSMRRLDQFERMGQAPKDYSTWCEHALTGAYDWMDPERGGDTGAAPRTNGPSPSQAPKVPEWLDSRRQADGQQKRSDDNDEKRNIFRIFTN